MTWSHAWHSSTHKPCRPGAYIEEAKKAIRAGAVTSEKLINADNFAVCGFLRILPDATRAYARDFRGIVVAPSSIVNTSRIDPTPASEILHEPTTFGRWTFHRKGRMITCEITVSHHSFDVCVITHWNAALSVIEAYDTPASAVGRHEDVVSALRRGGWVRVSETITGDLTAA